MFGFTTTDKSVSGNGRENPFHKLGTVCDGLLTASEVYERAFGWEPEVVPVFDVRTCDGFAEYVEIPGKVNVRRSDTQVSLGIFGENYQPMGNGDLLRLADAIVAIGGRHYETAGTLNGGRRVWALVAPEQGTLTIGGEDFLPYLLVASSHDGTMATTIVPTYVRTICQNTLHAAIVGGTASQRIFRARHTRNATVESVERAARNALDIGYAVDQQFAAEVEQLMQIEFTRQQFVEMVDAVIVPAPQDLDSDSKGGRSAQSRYEATRDQVLAAWSAPTVGHQGTGWGAVMAISDYELWSRRIRNGDRAERQAESVLDAKQPLTRLASEFVLASV